MKEKEELITQSNIIEEFGWSKTLIEKFLTVAETKRNPVFACASPMKLYRREDVLSIMQTDEFKNEYEKMLSRRNRGKLIAQNKEDETLRAIRLKMQEITVSIQDNIEERAIHDKREHDRFVEEVYHNNYYLKEDTYEDAPQEVKDRWAVNYIRHNLTQYEKELYYNHNKVGCNKAYILYKNAVLSKIAEVYPQYAQECERQKTYLYTID